MTTKTNIKTVKKKVKSSAKITPLRNHKKSNVIKKSKKKQPAESVKNEKAEGSVSKCAQDVSEDKTKRIAVSTKGDIDLETFKNICRKPHNTMKRCFMTGKPCVYAEIIRRRDQEVHESESQPSGFVAMPFRPNLNAFYSWSLSRLFQTKYGADAQVLNRADQVRRTGYVICEKICRKIQESSFIVIDVSINNPNVFYEFGLAYGLKHKLFIVHDIDSVSVESLKSRFLPDDVTSKMYAYPNLKPIPVDEGFSHRFYCPDDTTMSQAPRLANPRIVIIDLDATDNLTSESQDDISLSFMDVINGAIGVSLDNIVKDLTDEKAIAHIPGLYLDIIRQMKNVTKEFGPSQDAPFENIRSAIDSAFCIMIKTSKAHPFAYFWLGYCHAKGKNVIPICEIDVEKYEDVQIDDLAFDIRSLWHLALYKKSPTDILSELQEILQQMILTDFVEWSRKPFWSRIFGTSGRVSIFTGTLHNPDFKREMVGDWDLRTASELMSYFSTHQLISMIESPIYPPEKVKTVSRSQYRKQIGSLLKNKNAIVIASPDVNPLTELLLGQLYDVPEDKLFPVSKKARKHKPNEEYPRAVIAIKKRINTEKQPTGKDAQATQVYRFFFADEPASKQKDELIEERGFRANWLPKKELLEKYLGQMHLIEDNFSLYAHLVIAFNPFDDESDYGSHYVVILNGVSGPSTFALTQLLTGGIGKEFVDYSKPAEDKENEDTLPTFFNPNNESESILKQITEQLDKYVNKDSDFIGVQMIVKVKVGLPHKPADDQGWAAFDSRRVKGWKLEPGTLKLIERSKLTTSKTKKPNKQNK